MFEGSKNFLGLFTGGRGNECGMTVWLDAVFSFISLKSMCNTKAKVIMVLPCSHSFNSCAFKIKVKQKN